MVKSVQREPVHTGMLTFCSHFLQASTMSVWNLVKKSGRSSRAMRLFHRQVRRRPRLARPLLAVVVAGAAR